MAEAISNREQLCRLLEDFFMVTGIRISFWLPNGKKYVSCDEKNPESDFCAMIKSNPVLCQMCDLCDNRAITKARMDRETTIYTCHAGIVECVHPVIQDGTLLGFLMIGQTRVDTENPEEVKQRIDRCRPYGIDTDMLYECYMSLPVMNRDKLLAATRLLKSIACYTYLNGYVRYATPSVVVRAEDYIKKHLSEKITLDEMARSLFISKSKLCHTIRSELDLTVVDFINIKRIENVKQMLLDGHNLMEAAYASGFSDCSYCSKVFKKVEGISAKAFLKNQQA